MATPMKHIYFTLPNGKGARGFVTRVCLRASGQAFEDERLTFATWGPRKAGTPLGQLPVLEVGGVAYTQSIPLSAHAAKLAGLYPTTPLEQLQADEFVAIVDDMWNKGGSTPNEPEKRAAYANEVAPKFLRLLEARLGDGPFLGGSPTPRWADLWLYAYVSVFTSGFFDSIPADFVEKAAPKVAALSKAVAASELYAKFGTPE